jgi:hypothetical protein
MLDASKILKMNWGQVFKNCGKVVKDLDRIPVIIQKRQRLGILSLDTIMSRMVPNWEDVKEEKKMDVKESSDHTEEDAKICHAAYSM